MKICWDNIEKLKLTKYGNFFDGKRVYVEKDECKNCKESFLARIDNMGDFCSLSCKKSGRFHHNYGKSFFTNKGHFHPSWKGGYETRGLPVYDIIFPKLKNIEKMKRNKKDSNILEVACAYCGRWFVPHINSVRNRIAVIEGKQPGDQRFYCSKICKGECSIYNRTKYPKGFKIDSSREVQPELRQLVFKRDNYTCQKCRKHKSELKVGLHCHHITGIEQNPVESADVDNCVALCKKCHKKIHSEIGCRYFELRCEGVYNGA